MPKPLAAFDADGQPPVLSYNVPAPTSYAGRSYTELDFGGVNVFKDAARHRDPDPDGGGNPAVPGQKPPGTVVPGEPEVEDLAARDRLAERIDRLAVLDLPVAQLNALVRTPQPAPPQSLATQPGLSRLQVLIDDLGKDAVVEQIALGGEFVERTSALGDRTILAISQPTAVPTPRLALVEVYRLSSYLANYGAGRTVSTFTLLPGEEMNIHVKTYRHFSQANSRAESILDSFSSSSEQEFASALQQENSAKGSEQGQFSWHAEGQAEATWGWGKAKVSGGVAGSSNSSRDTFAKTVSSATAKHVAKASASRDVEINTSTETKTEEGEETAIERKIRNINLSRTLNFVFRQMNQEFVTLLHLVDARVAFHNGSPTSYREVSLSQLDDLLDEVISDGTDGSPDHRDLVRGVIVGELSSIVDYQDHLRSYVEEFQPRDSGGQPVGQTYLRARRDLISTYTGTVGSDEIRVPGIILAAQTNVLRTEGLVVEALLGQGEALDEYSRGLQREAVRTQRVRNSHAEAEADRQELANRIVAESPNMVDAFTKVNLDHKKESFVLPHTHVVTDVGPN